MCKLKNGDTALVVGNGVIRRSNGKLERLNGNTAKIIQVNGKSCLCDIGIGKLIALPEENLRVA